MTNSCETSSGLARLCQTVRSCESILVAYSGGVDSALLMAVAHRELGDRALACIGRSSSLAESELCGALELAAHVGFRCRVVETAEQEDPRYLANSGDRCYFCKQHLFQQLVAVARKQNLAV